jgi:hypothetical protein
MEVDHIPADEPTDDNMADDGTQNPKSDRDRFYKTPIRPIIFSDEFSS